MARFKATSKQHSPLNEQQLKKIIRSMGIKVTDQRMAILEEIHSGDDHVTAQEVYEHLSHKYPDIGFATVYRFLRTLTNYKILSEVRIQGLPARYEWADKKHHDHISCSTCGKISEFENDEIERLQLQISKSLGYKLTHHILELYGVCDSCQKQQSQTPSQAAVEIDVL